MQVCHVFWCVLACLAIKVTCRRRRVNVQDVDYFFSQDFHQGGMQMPYDDSFVPQRQSHSSQLEFSSVYGPSQQKPQRLQQGFGKLEKLVQQDDCRILYDSVSSRHHHPMILRSDKKGFLYPTMEGEDRILEISNEQTVLASCPGPANSLHLTPRTTVYITCKRGQLYNGRQAVHWYQLGCRKKPRPTLKRGKRCGSSSRRGRTYSILWPIRRGTVIPQLTLCFDERQETVIFTHHQIHGKNIDAKIVESSRPGFKKENMFSISANNAYSKRAQAALFGRLLQSDQHLTKKKQHYLARGHLAPDSDFILEPEQDATYYYANAVPQWQAVNNGNWKSLENSVRELAEDRRRTLDIWTGTFGILHLPDARDNPIELFLGLTDMKEVIPVPALLWKVVHDPASRSAVAIVEVNDVRGHGSTDTLSLYDPPCKDLCSEIPWVDWDVHDNTDGRTFCCSVQDLKDTIPNIPDLGYVSILRS